MTICCIVGLKISLSLYIFLYLSDFLSFILQIKEFFVKDFSKPTQATVVIFGMQVDDKMLHCGLAIQPSAAYSSLYLSDFLSFHTLNNENFRQRFL